MKLIEEIFDKDCNYITDDRYTEIVFLHNLLDAEKIPHTFKKFMDGFQVIYPLDGEKRVMDAVQHYGSYGNEENLIEIMGLLTPDEEEYDSVLGHLTAQNVFDRIKNITMITRRKLTNAQSCNHYGPSC